MAALSTGVHWAFLPFSSTHPRSLQRWHYQAYLLLPMNCFIFAQINFKRSNPYSIKLISLSQFKWQLATEQFRGTEIVRIKQNNQMFICIPFTLRKLQRKFNVKHMPSVLLSCKTLKRLLSQQQIEG